jgi:formate hydrogenlyase subunit 3/multisubunit Na+/H+ antiporter MnhD subunit
MINLSHIIALPIAAGLILWLLPESLRLLKGVISLAIAILLTYWACLIYLHPPAEVLLLLPDLPFTGNISEALNPFLSFTLDPLSKLIVLLAALFGLVISIYVLTLKDVPHFHTYFLITLGLSFGTVLASHLLLFLFFWGVLGLTLYKLIPNTDAESSATSKKTLIMIGSSDGIMILGIALFYKITGSFDMGSPALDTHSTLAALAFLCLLVGSFTKAGAFPFHSWIPDYALRAPAASSALLPASLDKLLGIYFLVRLCHDLFILSPLLRFLLLLLGSVTILAAVMMALVQHDYKKLLGFHAVSQVGYMVVGITLGTTLGIAAGIFHMMNHAIYKGGLFLAAGNIKLRTQEESLDRLGGLSKRMPLTFLCASIFALSISGVPPFNGFASKWLIYQGIIESGTGEALFARLWVVWLGVAVLGSALTLASFIKFIAGAFLGNLKEGFAQLREVNFLQWFPMMLLALACLGLGVFAPSWVIPRLLFPLTGAFEYAGIWQATDVSLLILFSLLLGVVIYLLTSTLRFRSAESFTGGEKFTEDRGFPVTHFYSTVREAPGLSTLYATAYKGWFDVYHLSKAFILWIYKGISIRHDGILQTYLYWVVAGLIILLLIM